jgi:hypothetical protein
LAARYSRDRWQVATWETLGCLCVQVGRDGVYIGPVHPRALTAEGIRSAILDAMAQIDGVLA